MATATAPWKPPRPVHPIGGPIEVPRQFALDGYLTAEQLLALAEIACLGSRKCVVVADTLREMATTCRKCESFVDAMIASAVRAGYVARMTPAQYEVFRATHGLTAKEFAPPVLPRGNGKLTVFLWRFPDHLADVVLEPPSNSPRRKASNGPRPRALNGPSTRAIEPESPPACAVQGPSTRAFPRAPALRNPGSDYENDDHDHPHSPSEPRRRPRACDVEAHWGRLMERQAVKEAASPTPAETAAPPPLPVPSPQPAPMARARPAPLPPLQLALAMVDRLGGHGHDEAVEAIWLFLVTELGCLPRYRDLWRETIEAMGVPEGGRVALREVLTATWRKGVLAKAGYLTDCFANELPKWVRSAQKRTPGHTRQSSPGVRSGRYLGDLSNRTQGATL